MDDIVEKLRDYGLTLEESIIICDRRAVDEAADLIETLQQKASDLEADYLRRHNDAVDRYERIIVLEADNARLAKELEEARKALEDEHRQFLAVGNMYVGKCFELNQRRSAAFEEAANIAWSYADTNQVAASIAAAIRHKATVTTDDLPEGGGET